jgi:hypothetical protein
VSEPSTQEPRRKRLDERAGPGWVHTAATLLRGTALFTGIVLIALGFVSGGFFLMLTAVLAAVAVVAGFVLAGIVQRESWYERPNARPISLLLVAALPVGLIVFAQLAAPALTPAPVTAACFAGEIGRDEETTRELSIDPRLGSMEFRLSVPELRDGALRWWVTDPIGQIRWGGRVEDAPYEERATLTAAQMGPIGGRWTVTVRGETSRARYSIEWYAALPGQPVTSQPPACL